MQQNAQFLSDVLFEAPVNDPLLMKCYPVTLVNRRWEVDTVLKLKALGEVPGYDFASLEALLCSRGSVSK